ncbi:phosphomannomutase [Candidatus Saccharibacteria bacterium]|nr:phosphomannomutase [Candidatus Saccharibacteria bacterium]
MAESQTYVFRKEELKLNPYIFRTNDIRGIYEKDFDDDDSRAIGQAYGTWLQEKGKDSVALGMDNRITSPKIHATVLEGLMKTGIKVYDLGLVTTPMSYAAPVLVPCGGAMMVTASHLSSEWNGIKLSIEDRTIFGDEIQEVRKIAERKNFKEGKGSSEKFEFAAMYEAALQKSIEELAQISKEPKKRTLKVVVDSGNGTAGLYAPKLLRDIGCEVIEMHSRLDGTFPNHGPDPTLGPNMLEAINRVKKEKADLGMVFDPDADRVNICDEEGFVLWGDGILLLFARDILSRHPRTEILYNTQCSPAVEEDIVAHGGIPVMVPTGHSLVLNELRFYGGVFAGEYKCHFYFYDHYYGFDDALYAALRLVKILEKTDRPLSQIMSDVPFYHASGEVEIPVPDERKMMVQEKVKNELRKRYFVNEMDGARVKFRDMPNTWGLMRASGTFPKVEVFSWAKERQHMEKAKEILLGEVQKHL